MKNKILQLGHRFKTKVFGIPFKVEVEIITIKYNIEKGIKYEVRITQNNRFYSENFPHFYI